MMCNSLPTRLTIIIEVQVNKNNRIIIISLYIYIYICVCVCVAGLLVDCWLDNNALSMGQRWPERQRWLER